VVLAGREEVDQPAADGDLAAALDHVGPLVAGGHQPLEQVLDLAALQVAQGLGDVLLEVVGCRVRVAVRAAEYSLPAGLVAGIDASLRAQSAGDRLDEVLEELSTIRGEVGSPPLAAPIGQILGSQALIHVRDYTKGHPTIEANNHPVRHGSVVGIHNGIITNDEEILARHRFVRSDPTMTVDSAAIFALAERAGHLDETRVRGDLVVLGARGGAGVD
jgi:hypothetical protein